MQRIEVNVQTGEQKVIDLTPEEVADAQERTATEAAENAARPKPITVESLAAALKEKGILTGKEIEDAKEMTLTAKEARP